MSSQQTGQALRNSGFTLIRSFRDKQHPHNRKAFLLETVVGLRTGGLGQPVVSKTFRRLPNRDLPDEARILKSLPEHDNIVAFIQDSWDVPYPNDYTFILEFCNAGDVRQLGQYVKRTDGCFIPEPWLWHMFIQLVQALDFIHSQGIAHGDFQGSNWLLNFPNGIASGGFPNLVVTDFELSPWGSRERDLAMLGLALSHHLRKRDLPPDQDWSFTLQSWVLLCGRGQELPLTTGELRRTMIPMAQGLADQAMPLTLPPWAIEYFTNIQNQTDETLRQARIRPVDEQAEFRARPAPSAAPSTVAPPPANFRAGPGLRPQYIMLEDDESRKRFIDLLVDHYGLQSESRYTRLVNILPKLKYIRARVEEDLQSALSMPQAAINIDPRLNQLRIHFASAWMSSLGNVTGILGQREFRPLVQQAQRNQVATTRGSGTRAGRASQSSTTRITSTRAPRGSQSSTTRATSTRQSSTTRPTAIRAAQGRRTSTARASGAQTGQAGQSSTTRRTSTRGPRASQASTSRGGRGTQGNQPPIPRHSAYPIHESEPDVADDNMSTRAHFNRPPRNDEEIENDVEMSDPGPSDDHRARARHIVGLSHFSDEEDYLLSNEDIEDATYDWFSRINLSKPDPPAPARTINWPDPE